MDSLTETDTETDTEIDMDIDRDMGQDTDMELEYFCFPNGAIAPYGLPVTHHGASSNSAMNL
jgi:hypothetical protein